jgi:hypothetical protein
MKLYLQFGYGMMEHTAKLLEEWGDGGVILSPRDLEHAQLGKVATRAHALGAEVLLDPQCFVRDADHYRLVEHDYFKVYQQCSTGSILTGDGAQKVVDAVAGLAETLATTRFVVPGLLGSQIDEDWFRFHEQLIDAAVKRLPSMPRLATLALSAAATADEAQIEAIVERAARWDVEGFYIVVESPSGYLVEDPNWLANVLILVSGLKLLGRDVIVGYGNHQLLAVAAARADAMAAGTWLNVRSLDMDKFYSPEEEFARKTVWYYCPQALTEYKPAFLDIAQRNGVLPLMRPDPALGSTYADVLFSGPAPTSVKWTEPSAFRHYLTSLRGQVRQLTATSYTDALSAQDTILTRAEKLLPRLRKAGVFSTVRDFTPIIDVNRAALITLDNARGALLRRSWK